MDIFDEEIVKFWSALVNNGVQFILVGGYATNMNGYQRFIGDMDIWINNTPQNRKLLRKAFADYGLGDYEMIERMQFGLRLKKSFFHLDNHFNFHSHAVW